MRQIHSLLGVRRCFGIDRNEPAVNADAKILEETSMLGELVG